MFFRSPFFEGKRCTICKSLWEKNNRERINNSRKLNPNTNVSKKKWRVSNPKKAKLWRESNPEKLKKSIANWRSLNPEATKKAAKKYNQSHPEFKRASNSKRRAAKIGATPKWVNKDQTKEMKLMHKKALELEKLDDIKRHVDHIVPLQSDIVCGLHVPWNLQIMLASDNCKKGNKLK